MSQKNLVNKFEWFEDISKFNEDFIKNYNEENDEGYFLEVDVQYPEKLHGLHNDLPFLPERMKLGKVEKLVTNLHYKTEYAIHIRNLKQALNHGLISKKVHTVIKFIKKTWLKPCIDMNTFFIKNNFEKDFFKLKNNAVFGKTMENVRKHRNIRFVTTERRRNYLVSEPNYHTKKFFAEHLLAIEVKKNQILMNKLVYLILSIFDLSKTEMCEVWYDYVKTKYGENVKLSYIDTDNIVVHAKTDDIYRDIEEDVQT